MLVIAGSNIDGGRAANLKDLPSFALPSVLELGGIGY